jgi:hypothetical protein
MDCRIPGSSSMTSADHRVFMTLHLDLAEVLGKSCTEGILVQTWTPVACCRAPLAAARRVGPKKSAYGGKACPSCVPAICRNHPLVSRQNAWTASGLRPAFAFVVRERLCTLEPRLGREPEIEEDDFKGTALERFRFQANRMH